MGSLFLVRHATTAASAEGRNLGQSSDPGLSAAGLALAERLGRALADELAELPHDRMRLVSSPSQRCRQTSDAAAAGIGLANAAEVQPGLLEIDYGAWEGLTADEARTRDPALRAAWEADPYATRCPGGESGSDVAARAFPILDEIDDWLAADRARCAIVVAHNHVNRLRLCALMGWPMRQYRERVTQDPGGYSIVTHSGGRRLAVVRRLNASPA